MKIVFDCTRETLAKWTSYLTGAQSLMPSFDQVCFRLLLGRQNGYYCGGDIFTEWIKLCKEL